MTTFETQLAAAVILVAGWTFLLVRVDKQPLPSAFRTSLKTFGLPATAVAVLLALLRPDVEFREGLVVLAAVVTAGAVFWTRSALLNLIHRR